MRPGIATLVLGLASFGMSGSVLAHQGIVAIVDQQTLKALACRLRRLG